MTIYHPSQQQGAAVFQAIPLNNRKKLSSSEVIKFGRNPNICQYTFQDKQVSRVQFSLQLFKELDSSVLSFEIKNLSKRTSLLVDNRELGYLNKVDLPYRCMVRFGDYQFLLEKQDGESLEFFETQFFLSPRSLVQEVNWPVPEFSRLSSCSTQSTSPIEIDENEF
ncbi:TRAF-interacting protein with FHA domain-containing protein A isoform X2 [Erinaceus europaeus]|nr:TRAF-interacting protein with FHA domain-containing protein A isoform X2 [Erinaceus europaeus]